MVLHVVYSCNRHIKKIDFLSQVEIYSFVIIYVIHYYHFKYIYYNETNVDHM